MSNITIAQMQSEIQANKEIHEQALAKTEGGEFSLIPAGMAIAVCTGYIEIGKHTNPKGKQSNRGKLVFQLFDPNSNTAEPKYTRKFDDNGTEVIVGSKITHNINTISRRDNANMRKELDSVFKAIGETETSPTMLIGKHFLVPIVHNDNPNDPKRPYVNMDLKNAKAPFGMNPDTMETDFAKPLVLPVDPASLHISYFLWDAPSALQWDTIYIDGEREVEVNGVKTKKSNNWIQELIKSADNFEGSPASSMIMQLSNTSTPLPTATKASEAISQAPAPSTPEVETKATEVAPMQSAAVSEDTTAPVVAETAVSKLSEAEQAELVRLEGIEKMLTDMGSVVPTDVSEKLVDLRGRA